MASTSLRSNTGRTLDHKLIAHCRKGTAHRSLHHSPRSLRFNSTLLLGPAGCRWHSTLLLGPAGCRWHHLQNSPNITFYQGKDLSLDLQRSKGHTSSSMCTLSNTLIYLPIPDNPFPLPCPTLISRQFQVKPATLLTPLIFSFSFGGEPIAKVTPFP